MQESYVRLLEFAKDALANAYAPYSKFPVGAAVLTEEGEVYTGVNVENSSYGLSICAERVAIAKAISEGKRKIRAIAVAGLSEVSPCGACRQFILEFGSDIDVIYLRDGKIVVKKISELLADYFLLSQ